MDTPTTAQPILDRPGAGLPFPELIAARVLFRAFRRNRNTESLNKMIRKEKETMLVQARSLEESAAATPVLIERIPGIEDSSRFWSVYMTLEHVRIVNREVTESLALLSRGKVPDRESSTATVKPASGIRIEVLDTFARSCDALITRVENLPDLDRPEKYSHPWFGPLTIRGWHAFIPFHMRLHRKQIDAIIMANSLS